MHSANYFDNAASTPIHPQVLERMLPFLGEEFGNAHSLHAWGQRARREVESARLAVAHLIGAEDPEEIIFTSGATEANNQVLTFLGGGSISPFEHSSVREPALHLGFEILDNNDYDIEGAGGFVSSLLVNNETGAILRVLSGDKRHSDITQAVGKIPVSVRDLDLDYASFSAHKMHGPKGVGALYVRGGFEIEPLLRGGEQEMERRAGTLNVPAIAGFGEAARMAADHPRLDLVPYVLEGLTGFSDWRSATPRVQGSFFPAGPEASPGILSLSFFGVEGEALAIEMDRLGFGISSGAACSTGSTEPSHVLEALGIEPEWARGTVRISFSQYNDRESAAKLAVSLRLAVDSLRKLRG